MATTYGSTHPSAKRDKPPLFRALRYVICGVAALLILLPLMLAVWGGLKSSAQLIAEPFAIPDPIVWSNYTDVITSSAFWRQCGNSVLVLVATTSMVLGIASCAAFVFARFRFRGREAVFTYFTLGLLFP